MVNAFRQTSFKYSTLYFGSVVGDMQLKVSIHGEKVLSLCWSSSAKRCSSFNGFWVFIRAHVVLPEAAAAQPVFKSSTESLSAYYKSNCKSLRSLNADQQQHFFSVLIVFFTKLKASHVNANSTIIEYSRCEAIQDLCDIVLVLFYCFILAGQKWSSPNQG